VASFCTKCGAALSPDTQFCTACGAPVVAAAGPAVPAYSQPPATPYSQPPATQFSQPTPQSYPPPMPPPLYPQTSVPPPSSGNSAVKIILIVVAVFIGLAILGAAIFAFSLYRIAHSVVHVDGPNGQVTLNTPGGSMQLNSNKTYSAEELGTDLYPGALSVRGGMNMNTPNGSMVTGVFVTSDSKDQVLAFYKSKLGSDASVIDTSEASILTVNKGNEESVMVTVTQKPGEDDGKTKIAIVHTKSNKSS
jgi:zinc-ribbon domain